MPASFDTFFGTAIQGMRVTWSNTYNANTLLTAATLTADIQLNLSALQLTTFDTLGAGGIA